MDENWITSKKTGKSIRYNDYIRREKIKKIMNNIINEKYCK